MTDEQTYHAVVNDEEQYSIWPVDLPVPGGWRPAGQRGSKEECLAYIGQVWTDMRPASLRAAMADTHAE
jgi:MbtH protein